MTKALLVFQKAGEMGCWLGWTNLGDLYYYGEHVPKDYDKALEYYLKTRSGRINSEDKLAEIYFEKQEYNKVLPVLKQDYEERFAPIYYGIMYEMGLGVKVNNKKAIHYYEKAMLIDNYPTAVQQLLVYYRKDSEYANEERFNYWLQYAEENEIEIDRIALGLEEPKKDSFFNRLFKP